MNKVVLFSLAFLSSLSIGKIGTNVKAIQNKNIETSPNAITKSSPSWDNSIQYDGTYNYNDSMALLENNSNIINK